MVHRGFLVYVLPPLLVLEVHIWAVQLLGVSRHGFLFAENGIVELGTAAGFVVAAGLALRLVLRSRGSIPRIYRCLFSAFALAAMFVALEELSYGQHLFGWEPPAFFARNSTKNELNLHNLYHDSLSNVLRQLANLGFPLCCVVFPWIATREPAQFVPGRWAFYLAPRWELAATVLVADVLSPFDKFLKSVVGATMLIRPGELQELFWSAAACLYVLLIQRRLEQAGERCDVLPFEPASTTRMTLRKAA